MRERGKATLTEEQGAPEGPTELTKRSWKYVLRSTIREFSDDECTDQAAALTYYAMLAVFPAAIAVLALLGIVGQGTGAIDALLEAASDAGASSAADTLRPSLEQLSRSQSSGLALAFGVAAALWSASGYVGAFGRAMNRVWEVGEGRPAWKLRPLMFGMTCLLVVLVAAVAAALVVTGPVADSLGDQVGAGSTAVLVWEIAKWPALLAVVIFVVALLYYATPNVKPPKFRWLSVGAIVAIAVWMLLSAAFGLYVASFSSYNETYGSLAGVVVFLLWLWLTNLALLFGAELDAELERGRELQAGLAAEREIQRPLRDTRKVEKAAAKEEDAVRRGREIRESSNR
jgi:membrane protein